MPKVIYYVIGKAGWDIEGKIGKVIGDTYGLEIHGKGTAWIPVLWQGEEDPDWVKSAGVIVVHQDKLAEEIMKVRRKKTNIRG